MADNLADLLAEKQRREGKLDTGYRSVLDKPEETTSLEEVKRFTQSLLKGSAKGIVDLVGGWGNLYDYIKKNPEPSGLSSKGIVNAISNLGGPDLMKLQGYKGAYDIGQAGAPAALMGAMTPAGSLFSGTTGTAARAGKEFVAGGTIGLLGQQAAPESPYAQLTLQTLPYLVKGGIGGLKERKNQALLNDYKKLLPESDVGIFDKYVLKGQGSSDPAIAADIARLTRSPKYLEMVTALNEGATAEALKGMAPKGSQLTPEQAKTGIIQAVQNKLAGIRESNADSLFEKAKGYGGGTPLVDTANTIGKIDGLIARYSAQSTPNAERAVQALTSIKDRLTSQAPVDPAQAAFAGAAGPLPTTTKRTVEQVQGVLSEFGKKASAGDSLIKDLSISDERIISSAIFGGMKDDVAAALKGATGADKAALNLLNTARDRVSKASTAYNEAVAQGLPASLHNKSLAEISPEDLYSTYKNLTPAQRGTMREWVGTTDQAALDVLDKQVFSEFVNQAKKTNALGVETVDLATLAQNWRALEKVPGAQDSLAVALGSNKTEFGQRMKDAELFTRKMSVAQPTTDQAFTPAQVRETQAAIGGVAGYGPAKIGQLAMDTLNTLTNNGLSEEQLMKVLLTDSGKSFLKSASLSPRSQQALTDLMKVDETPLEALGKWGAVTVARMGPRIGAAEQPTVQQETPNVDVNAEQDDLKALLEEKNRRMFEENPQETIYRPKNQQDFGLVPSGGLYVDPATGQAARK